MAFCIPGKQMQRDIFKDFYKGMEGVNKCCSLGKKQPLLAIVLLGPRDVFKKNMETWAKQLCTQFIFYEMSDMVEEEEIVELIDNLNKDDDVNGILLSNEVYECDVIYDLGRRILPAKDVGGYYHHSSVGQRIFERLEIFAVKYIILKYNISLSKKRIGVVGSDLVFIEDLVDDITETVRTKHTGNNTNTTIQKFHYTKNTQKSNLQEFCKQMDLLICTVCLKKIITADMIKEGACIIDGEAFVCETNSTELEIVGCTDCEEVPGIKMLPTPGSFGYLTQTFLMQNLMIAAQKQAMKMTSK